MIALAICSRLNKFNRDRLTQEKTNIFLDKYKDELDYIILGGRFHIDMLITTWANTSPKVVLHHITPSSFNQHGTWKDYARLRTIIPGIDAGLVWQDGDRLSNYAVKLLKEHNKKILYY